MAAIPETAGSVLGAVEQRREAGGGVDRQLLERLVRLVPVAGDESDSVTVRAPFSGEVLGSFPRCTPQTVRKAAQRARRAQAEWAGRSIAERGAIFVRFHDLILDRQAVILDLIQAETGKARKHAFEEVADVAIVARYYVHSAERHLAVRRRKGALPGLTATREYHHPTGVVGIISPWNYPLSLAVTDAIPALMAGNAVVLKPDRQTSFTALWAVELLQEAGLPFDLFQVVTGSGAELGEPLIDEVDYTCFTGSTATGRKIAGLAAERLKGCSLELGGKNAMIVLADADLEATVEGALRGCFANTGQLCISIERLYVERPVQRPFVERFVARTQELELGAGLDFEADLGSLVSEQQLRTVQSHVQDAVEKGAVVLAGGRPRPDLGPYFFEPTILENVRPGMTLFDQETFGPVVSLYPFDTVDEAIEAANDSRYGLNASVWTGDTAAGIEIARRIRAGTVNVNEAYAAAWASVDAPMGGCKESGLGRRHGAEGILKYTEAQTIAVQRGLPIAAPPALGEEAYSRWMSRTLKLLRRVPGLR
jgi:acyl-CoA reductase-like NAD-dependent aldehyde dehydrogenase